MNKKKEQLMTNTASNLGKGTSNSIAFIAHEVDDIKAASCTTWNGLPPAIGSGT